MKFKKLIAVAASVAMLAASAVPALAGTMGEDYGTIPYVATAPVVDAQMDDVYADALKITVDHLEPGLLDTGLTAECYLVWNGDSLYAYYNVFDPDVLAPDAGRSKNPWDYDNVEFFIDYDGSSYSADDTDEHLNPCIQYRIDVSGYQSVYGFTPEDDSWSAYGLNADQPGSEYDDQGRYAGDFYEAAGNFTSDVYAVEYKLPLTNTHLTWGEDTIEPGETFGINIQVTDLYTGGSESSRYRLPGVDDWAWDAQYWPNVTLGEGPAGVVEPDPAPVEPDPAPVEPDPAPVEPDPAPVTPAPAPNPGTADVTAIFSVLASLSAVAGLAISKRK